MKNDQSFGAVLKNRGFLNLWLNQVLVQLSYNALNFALIIWVFRLTDSNLAVSILLFSVYLPAVLLGLFSGTFVDITDRKKIISLVDFLLALCFFSLILTKDSYILVLLTAFLINSLAQFYTPAESSSIPLIVPKPQLLMANSLFSITLFTSFLLGFGLAGPLINFFDINFVFGLGGALLLLAFFFSLKFPSIKSKKDEEGKKLTKAIESKNYLEVKKIALIEMVKTLSIIKGRLVITLCLFILAGVQVVIGILGSLIPSFFEKVIKVNATDASFILIIPLGLGMVLGGFLVGRIGHKFPRRIIIGSSVIVAGLLFLLIGLAPLIFPVIKYFPHRPLPFFYQPSLSKILAAGSFLLGIAMVSIVVPTQTTLQENTTEQIRGKVYASLGVLMAALTLIPVLLVGGFADLFGTMPIFMAMGGIIFLIGLLILRPQFYFAEHHLPYKIREFLGLGHWKK